MPKDLADGCGTDDLDHRSRIIDRTHNGHELWARGGRGASITPRIRPHSNKERELAQGFAIVDNRGAPRRPPECNRMGREGRQRFATLQPIGDCAGFTSHIAIGTYRHSPSGITDMGGPPFCHSALERTEDVI